MKWSIHSVTVILFYLFAFPASYAALPFKTVIYDSVTEGPMMKSTSSHYDSYDGDAASAISAEWRTESIMGRQTRTLVLSKQGKVYNVNLVTRQCTVTDVSGITHSITDPEGFAKSLRQQMNFQQAGSCTGAGMKGIKYTSQFGEMCFYKDVFMLWQKTMGTNMRVTKVTFDQKLPQDKISLPAGIECIEGPDLSKGLPGMKSWDDNRQSDPQSDEPRENDQQPSQQDIEKAMEQAKDVMKKLFGN